MGECSAIVAAHRMGYLLAIDDVAAIKVVKAIRSSLQLIGTQEIMGGAELQQLGGAGANEASIALGPQSLMISPHQFVKPEDVLSERNRLLRDLFGDLAEFCVIPKGREKIKL